MARKGEAVTLAALNKLETRRPLAARPETAPRLRTAVGRLTRRLRRTSTGELTQTQISTLVTLQGSGPLRLNELARCEGICASTISRLVDSLEQAGGLVARTPDACDARASQVALTGEGSAVLEDLRRNGTRLIDRALRSLDESERAAVDAALPALEKLVEAVETMNPDGTDCRGASVPRLEES